MINRIFHSFLCIFELNLVSLTLYLFSEGLLGGGNEIFAHFSVKNLIEIGLKAEKSHSKMLLGDEF